MFWISDVGYRWKWEFQIDKLQETKESFIGVFVQNDQEHYKLFA